jgi:hypothetical protein
VNERIKELMNQARALYRNQDLPHEQGLIAYSEKFAELLLKDAFTIIKESMIGEDMTVVEEIIADRLDDAAGDVCDQLGLMGPIYEG